MTDNTDFDFCGIPFQTVGQNEYAFMGPDPDTLRDYYANRDGYDYVHFDEPVVKYILPEQIGGIQLSQDDLNDPDSFWSMHRENGTIDTFRAVAEMIPRVRSKLDQGWDIYWICRNPDLARCAQLYFLRPQDIPVVDLGTFYLFQSNGRHRLLAAMGLGHEIPVSIIGSLHGDLAFWKPLDWNGRYIWAQCSNCGFKIEGSRAVEIGFCSNDYLRPIYKFCPMCGKRMAIKNTKGETVL